MGSSLTPMLGIVKQKKCSSLHGLLFFNHNSSRFDISSSFEKFVTGDSVAEE